VAHLLRRQQAAGRAGRQPRPRSGRGKQAFTIMPTLL
jgi:hypothetical protein